VSIALLVDDRRFAVWRFTEGGEERLTGDARIDLDLVLPGFDLTVRALLETLRID
jgi:hypothetical protein